MGRDDGPLARESSTAKADVEPTIDLDQPRMQARPAARLPASPARSMRKAAMAPAPATREPQHGRALPLAPGRVLLDRYVLVQTLGIGGTCMVFRARDLQAGPSDPRFVALKTPRPEHPDPQRAIERLRRKFEHTQRLSHVGIVQVFEWQHEDDVWFMTMELLEGETLAALVRRHAGSIPPALATRLLRGAAEALHYAHSAGIPHGDFSPAKLFVLAGDRIKLLDFGTPCSGTQQATTAATFAYASPQILEGASPCVRDDVFSFACVAYEMIAGQHPFEFRPATEARTAGSRPQAPASLTSEQAMALMSGLAWERESRQDDIRAFARSILPESPKRLRAPAPEPLQTPPRRLPSLDDRHWWLLIAACVVAMIVAVIATRLIA